MKIEFNIATLTTTFAVVKNDFDEPIEYSRPSAFPSEFHFITHLATILRMAAQ